MPRHETRRPYASIATVALVAALVALGVAAAVFAFRGFGEATGSEREAGRPKPSVEGPDVPPPGVLPGSLVLADADGCRLRILDFATLELGDPGPETSCRLWVSPSGDRAVFERPAEDEPGPELWLVDLDGDAIGEARRLGRAVSSPSWSPDGRSLAWCEPGGTSRVLGPGAEDIRSLPGCFPELSADGSVVTRVDDRGRTRLLRDGAVLVDEDALVRGTGVEPGATRIVGHAVRPDGSLALAVHRSGYGFQTRTDIELWDDGVRTATLPITGYGPVVTFFGLRVELAPNGAEAAVTAPAVISAPRRDDLVSLVDLRSGRLSGRLAEQPFNGFAWSPDSAWAALSTGREILVYGAARSDPVYVIPLPARALAWR